MVTSRGDRGGGRTVPTTVPSEVPPYGMAGGSPGALGRNLVHRVDGTVEELPGSTSVALSPGDVLEIHTPGGGGYGAVLP